jgi:hypothetical protein
MGSTRRYHVDATWCDGYVELEYHEIEPLTPEHAARLIERGMLRADDEPVGRVKIGEMRVTEPRLMTPKRVKIAGRAWLAEHAEGPALEIEWQFGSRELLEALARLEAAVNA